MGSGHQKGGWHECRELETPGDELGHSQACSLDFECREKPSKGFKGETGMMIYAGIFGVMAGLQLGGEAGRSAVWAGWGRGGGSLVTVAESERGEDQD